MSPQTEKNKGASLQVGGVTPLTCIDYPDELSAVIFCQGCPWRCRYCHNGGLLQRHRDTGYQWPAVLEKLEHRTGLLDAVVFSGGEPTLHRGLPDAVHDIKNLGFKAGLHTAGCYPDRLKALLPMLDWVGLDIKSLSADYARTTGVTGSGDRAWKSLELLLDSDTACEVRITIHSELLPESKLLLLLQRLNTFGVKQIALQQCDGSRSLDQSLGVTQLLHEYPECIDFAEKTFEKLILRHH